MIIKQSIEKKTEDFSWETVLACHPDKLAKLSADPPCSPLTPRPSSPSKLIPTYAMLNVIKRMREKQNSVLKQKVCSK